MEKINGQEIANKIIANLKSQPKPEKFLAVILAGQNSVSLNFIKQKTKIAKELGVDLRVYNFPEEIQNDDLREEVNKVVSLKKVGGVIVQLPLPPHLNPQYILNVIPREKDVDVLGERALGAFYNGRNPVLPPSVGVVEEILNSKFYILNSKKVAVVGLGFLIGKLISIWLTGKTKEIYLLDEGSNFEILRQADLVILGVGKAGIIKPEMLKNDAVVIDFGYSFDENDKIRGDFDTSEIGHRSLGLGNFRYTPTPAGTGPILVAKLFENFYRLNAE